MQLTQIDVTVLSRLVNKVSTPIAAKLNTGFVDVENFLNRFVEFVRANSIAIGNKVFAIEITSMSLACSTITSQQINQCLEIGKECGRMDLNFNFELHPELDSAELPSVCNYAEENNSIFLRIEGASFQPIINGVVKAIIDTISPGAPEARLTKYARSCKAYDQLIKDHHRYCLPSEMDLYWKDRIKRVLIADRQTEKVLQKSLWRWLELTVTDGRVRGEVQKLSPEKTDIEILGFRGNIYIFEIKWLGKNAANNSYDETRIKEGVNQVKNYLVGDQTATKAVLVCYDGRTKTEHELKSFIDPADMDPRGDYYVLFLPSDAASDQGGN